VSEPNLEIQKYSCYSDQYQNIFYFSNEFESQKNQFLLVVAYIIDLFFNPQTPTTTYEKL
jgi:hypothetical protein